MVIPKFPLFVAIIVIGAFLSIGRVINRAQSQTPSKSATSNSGSQVKPTVMLPDSSVRPSGNGGLIMALPAARNEALSRELVWTFGGKQQKGWYLYTRLINRLLGTEADTTSVTFAAALSKWQSGAGLTPTGVLDEATLDAIIGQWQSMRLKDRTVALPDQLLTAPVSDFYDPERLPELRQVERETYAAYRRLIAAAVAEPSLGLGHDTRGGLAETEKYLKIISSFRTPAYQEQLRRQAPGAGTAGLAIHSPHFTGRALDLYVGGEPVSTADFNRQIQVQTVVYKWLVQNAARFGFHPYFYEPWHWEYTGEAGDGSKK
jgi:hypothetical protein